MYKSSDLDLLKQIGVRIREIRIAKKFTLKELAYTIGMEASNLSVIENGKSNPQILTYAKIAGALNVDLKDLLSFDFNFSSLNEAPPIYKPRKHK